MSSCLAQDYSYSEDKLGLMINHVTGWYRWILVFRSSARCSSTTHLFTLATASPLHSTSFAQSDKQSGMRDKYMSVVCSMVAENHPARAFQTKFHIERYFYQGAPQRAPKVAFTYRATNRAMEGANTHATATTNRKRVWKFRNLPIRMLHVYNLVFIET